MPKVTIAHHVFAEGIASGLTQPVAYKAAFRTKYDVTHEHLRIKATKMANRPEIKALIAQIRKPAARVAQVTLVDHLQRLAELRDGAVRVKQFSAAVSAETARAKAAGLAPEDLPKTIEPIEFIRAVRQ